MASKFVLGLFDEKKIGCMVYFSTESAAEQEFMRQRLFNAINRLNRKTNHTLDSDMQAKIIKAIREDAKAR